VDGLMPAVWVGAAVVLLGAAAALLVPARRRTADAAPAEAVPEAA